MHRHCYVTALSFSTGINGTPGGDSWPSLWVKQASLWARNWGPDKNNWDLGANPLSLSGKALTRLFFLLPQLLKCQELIRGCITLELRGGTLTRTKWCHFVSLLSMLWLGTFQMGLIIYVSLLLLTPKILSLPFDPQDNAFLSWDHSYAAFHNQSNCWVCGALPSSSVEGFPWWTSPLQGKDFRQVCKYLQQQLHAIPLLHLMTSTNPKIDWCNTLHFNYGHNVTLTLILTCFNNYVPLRL